MAGVKTSQAPRLTLVVGLAVAMGVLVYGQQVQPAAITPVLERSGVKPGTRMVGALRVELPPGLHMQSNTPRDPALIPTVVTFAPSTGVAVPEVVFPAPVEFTIPGIPGSQLVYEKTFLIGVSFLIDPAVKPGTVSVPARFRYQACDDKACYPPKVLDVTWQFYVLSASAVLPPREPGVDLDRIAFGHGTKPPLASASVRPPVSGAVQSSPVSTGDVVKSFDEFDVRGTGGYMAKDEFLTFIANAEAGVQSTGLAGRGPLAVVALVFLGGVALNLTPCVLPMIPINLAIIGAGTRSNASRSRGLWLGSVYGGAMALVYGVLGLVVILTAGTFGTINSSPWFNVAIAVLFAFLGLAMFDIVNVDFSRFSSKIQFKQESRGTAWLAFGMGAVAALLAGACVAPVVIQVVVFASERFSAGSPGALALPFVLGVGMAVPWPLAGAGMSALPKPGPWMAHVKHAMGLFILAMGLYYGYVAYEGFSNRWVDPSRVTAGVEERLRGGWTASLSEGLAQAKREGKPVLLDFWATWCKNCVVMDTTTLRDPDVERALSGYVKIKIQSEDLDAAPHGALLKRLRAVGLPAYAILRAR